MSKKLPKYDKIVTFSTFADIIRFDSSGNIEGGSKLRLKDSVQSVGFAFKDQLHQRDKALITWKTL